MQSRTMGVAIALAAVAAAVVLFVVLRDDDGEPTPAPPPVAEEQAPEPAPEGPEEPNDEQEPAEPGVPAIVLRDGAPVGGVQELTFRRGEQIEFVVRSSTDEELHLHGYDVIRNVEAGGRVRFNLEAEFDGVFEVETHPGHVVVAEIVVRP